MVITKLNRSFGELKVKYDRGETDTHEYKKKIKEYKKNIDQWLNFNREEFKEIKKFFSKCETEKEMLSYFKKAKSFGLGGKLKFNDSEGTLKLFFSEFKKSKKISETIKKMLVDFDSLEIRNFLKVINELLNMVSNFSKEDMLKEIKFIINLINSNEEEKSGHSKYSEKFNQFVNYINKNLDNFRKKYQNIAELESDIHIIRGQCSTEFNHALFRNYMMLFVGKTFPNSESIVALPELTKLLNDKAENLKYRIDFLEVINHGCENLGLGSEGSVSQKSERIFNQRQKIRDDVLKTFMDKVVRKFENFEDEMSKKSNRSLPPILTEGNERVLEKSLSTPQKNSIDENNKTSQRKSVERLSLEQMKTLEESLNNKSKPLSKPSSEQRKDAIYSSEDESKNPTTSNDKSVKPKESKNRLSKLFGRKRKENNKQDNKQDNKSNKSWRKSLKNRLSKSFGKSSKPSNDTSTSSPNNAHQKELKRAVERRSQYIKPDEISTES